ncbi:YIP1 family protein [Paenibacillus larvae]
MIEKISNKKLVFLAVISILLSAILFEIYHSSAKQHDLPDIDGDIIQIVVIAIQGFSVLAIFIELLIGGFFLYLIGFFLGSKKPKKTYLLLYTLTTLVTSFKMLVMATVNVFTNDPSLIYSLKGSGLYLFDPFIILSTIILYFLSGKLTDLNKNKRVVLAFSFLILKILLITFSTGGE